MDILKPELLWIDGKCYRVPVTTQISYNEDSKYTDDTNNCMGGDSDCEEQDEDFDIDVTEGGRFRSSFRLPKAFFGTIIGPKGTTRRRLEEETRTQIKVPNKTQSCNIIITGNDEKSVASARRRINHLVSNARQKQPFTHFLAIPMVGKQIMNSFDRFQSEVSQICTNHRFDPSIFQKPQKLHLTLGMMTLTDEEERKEAVESLRLFKDTSNNVLLNKPFRLKMVGIEYMNDDPQEVDVLYAKVKLADEPDVLQRLADEAVEFFSKKGLMVNEHEHVKLHVTLINTKYRNDRTDDRKKKPRVTFDASDILDKLQNFDFGEQKVDSIQLCERFNPTSDGSYHVESVIKL